MPWYRQSQTLRDIDLVFIKGAFERLLLDYDQPWAYPHVFGVEQKYSHVAFDSTQKAVLTSCVLQYKPLINTSSDRKKLGEDSPSEEGFINCCFSFVRCMDG
ncbi:hypothetical protein JVT61DRAFT_12389 [Boletus reticuloceps]|uniref:Uncharacterized protein n=1 Tax=Boletus reticuloceps TaxID=495285 RepID=A0A8I2YDX4_9AGAM|nr:hypothetical protein JVT61DRAFT_12389 [Boletus reticuloceps]